jgi:hypothetical protein
VPNAERGAESTTDFDLRLVRASRFNWIQLARPGFLRPGPNSVLDQGGDQAFGIKDGFVLEHEVDGASQFDGQDRVGFELVALELGFEPLRQTYIWWAWRSIPQLNSVVEV